MGLRHLFAFVLPCVYAAQTYRNPVLLGDVPDPGVTWSAELSLWVMATTGCTDQGCFALHTSPDLVSWNASGYIFPAGTFPSWASSRSGLTAWAPEVHLVSPSSYVVYYVTRDGRVDPSNGPLCIGAASSSSALGPFKDTGSPLTTAPPGECYGVIDPTFYFNHSTGERSLVYKIDGNSCGKPTIISAIELAQDGLSLAAGATPRQLIQNDSPWEGSIVEAPWVVHNRSTGFLYLFYSGAEYDKTTYAVGVARAPTLEGPWEKNPGNPILRTGPSGSSFNYGPGHCSVVTLPAGSPQPHGMAIIYAGEQPPSGPFRNDLLDAIIWVDGWPAVRGGVPSQDDQPIPT